MHAEIGGRAVSDIEFVLAYDIDRRKVGQDLAQAIFAKPNCTAVFCADVPATGAVVKMGQGAGRRGRPHGAGPGGPGLPARRRGRAGPRTTWWRP